MQYAPIMIVVTCFPAWLQGFDVCRQYQWSARSSVFDKAVLIVYG